MVICLLSISLDARAQEALDVPYVGTPPNVVEAMLDMAQVGASDYVVDLGCGDGRIVIRAAKERGARGYGVDLDGALIHDARLAAERAGVQDRVRFDAQNLYVTAIGQATVLTLYLFPRVNLDLRPRIFRELRPGTRVVSHEFDFGSWEPDAQRVVAVPDKPYGEPRSTVYLWIVPANAAGRWTWTVGGTRYEMTLAQKFQVLTASVPPGVGYRIEDTSLSGASLRFTLVAGEQRAQYEGRIDADAVAGTIDGVQPWRGTRTAPGRMDIEAAVQGRCNRRCTERRT